ncbi:hypothetical protein CEXT_339031 [Caerostris extrusa]|uniref:Uncharacterized protein n=1 Tax=Caerostris extrusa TaxID=172846 RepID=A0AAV4SFT2_CAEEX|nr:hypothetical protein CEXT_339031 [Caerostris extrusa]
MGDSRVFTTISSMKQFQPKHTSPYPILRRLTLTNPDWQLLLITHLLRTQQFLWRGHRDPNFSDFGNLILSQSLADESCSCFKKAIRLGRG